MNDNQKVLIIVLATLAGLIGGFISNQIFQTKSAFAEKEPKPQKVVIAEEFILVDRSGKKHARLTASEESALFEMSSFGYSSFEDRSAGYLKKNSSVIFSVSKTGLVAHFEGPRSSFWMESYKQRSKLKGFPVGYVTRFKISDSRANVLWSAPRSIRVAEPKR
ncbi:MAG: hypothetical protein JSV31_19150 [Desulfobacterales bacterium]|nr:MAG: hypothetical protein JSV31_19150 [Desulfobacterales bacterium]